MMRRILFFSSLLVALSGFSQNKMRFSLMFNPGVSWYKSDDKLVKPDGTHFGFDAGLAADAFFSENYAFTTGISIGNYGGNLLQKDSISFETNQKTLIVPSESSVQYSIQYLTIPLGLKMKSVEIGYITYFAQVGMNSQFMIKTSATSNDKLKTLEKSTINNDINFFNIGYFFGGGIEYSIGGNSSIILGLLYNQGMIDVTKNDNASISSQSLSVRLGFLF